MEAYDIVLSEPEDNFAVALMDEMFASIKEKLLAVLETEEFKEKNQERFKKGTRYSNLILTTEKLRSKFKWLKSEWLKKVPGQKTEVGLSPLEYDKSQRINFFFKCMCF